MDERINIQQLEPEAYNALFGLEKYLGTIDVDPSVKELIKIRASQINGCAYCIQMHTEMARKNGESEQRIYALSAWRESPLFTDRERAVLALTDEVTLISQGGVNRDTYDEALRQLGEHALAQCIMVIVAINGWNRIGVATKARHT